MIKHDWLERLINYLAYKAHRKQKEKEKPIYGIVIGTNSDMIIRMSI